MRWSSTSWFRLNLLVCGPSPEGIYAVAGIPNLVSQRAVVGQALWVSPEQIRMEGSQTLIFLSYSGILSNLLENEILPSNSEQCSSIYFVIL